MRHYSQVLLVTVIVLFAVSGLVSAGSGLRLETEGLDKYTAAGFDLELGIPGIPLHAIGEVMGWWASNDDQTSHIQASGGARLYLGSGASGLFAEAKMRYIMPLEDSADAGTLLMY